MDFRAHNLKIQAKIATKKPGHLSLVAPRIYIDESCFEKELRIKRKYSYQFFNVIMKYV